MNPAVTQFLTLIGLGLNIVATLIGVVFIYGKLSQKVADHDRRLDTVEGTQQEHTGKIGQLEGQMRSAGSRRGS